MEFHTAFDLILATVFAAIAFGLGLLSIWLSWRESALGRAMVLIIKDRDSYRARVDQLVTLNRQYQAEIDRLRAQIASDANGKVQRGALGRFVSGSKAQAGQ